MELIADPATYFEQLGGLHDAAVDWAAWTVDPPELRLVVGNLNANFMDGNQESPEYPGWTAQPASIVFTGLTKFAGHMSPSASTGGIISELVVAQAGDRYKVTVCGADTWVWMFECDAIGLDAAAEPAAVSAHYEQYEMSRI
jgi:hypothetical protein